jgi:selenocysteine-specific elongation factor
MGPPPAGEPNQSPLAPGSRGYVRLRLEDPVVLTRGDRFIIRAYSPSRTIGGGLVLDPVPPRTPVRARNTLERCTRLDFDPASGVDLVDADLRAAQVMIDDAGDGAFPLARLVSRIGIAPRHVPACVEALIQRGGSLLIRDVLVARRVVDDLKRKIVEALAEHHRAQPLSEGLAREEARIRLFGRGHPAVFERAVEDLTAMRTIVGRDRLALSTHRVALSPDAERARDRIDRAFREAGLAPPDLASVTSAMALPSNAVQEAVTLLQRQRVLVKIDTLLFHDEALKRLKQDLAAMKAAGEGSVRLDVSAFKERFGVTRKFAIPLLEYLDRERVTRRVGEVRVIL